MSNVRFLKEDEYDYWDTFVDVSKQGSCFSKSWWLKIATNNDFKICIYEGEGEIFAGLILPYFSTAKITMPLLTQSVGILFYEKNGIKLQKSLTNQKEQTSEILNFVEKQIKSFDIRFQYNYDYWLPFYWRDFRETTMYTYIIDYKDFDEKSHFSTLSKGHKWIINKVTKKTPLRVEELTDLSIYYTMAKKTYERQNITIGYSYDLLENFYKVLQEHNACKIFQVLDENNNIHAVNFIIYDKHEAYYWLGASDNEYRNIGGHTFLIWETIKYFQDKTQKFNFGGSMMEDVEKNFRNFSGVPTPYFNITKNDNILLKEIKRKISPKFKDQLKNLLSSVGVR